MQNNLSCTLKMICLSKELHILKNLVWRHCFLLNSLNLIGLRGVCEHDAHESSAIMVLSTVFLVVVGAKYRPKLNFKPVEKKNLVKIWKRFVPSPGAFWSSLIHGGLGVSVSGIDERPRSVGPAQHCTLFRRWQVFLAFQFISVI